MTKRETLTRREWLGLSGIAALSARLEAADEPAAGPSPDGAGSDQRPKSIIFMVSDGMSAGIPTLAEPFSQLARGRGTHWQALAEDDAAVRGYFRTGSLNTMVTDSAAASSAWGSGSRVFNGMLNVLPDGTKLTPIARLAKEAGKAVGLVTTTTITHATPAGFAAVERNRDNEQAIALRYLDLVDIALGGGAAFFLGEKRGDEVDLHMRYRQRGYTVCTTRDELMGAAGGTRLLGTFSEGHMPLEIDRLNQPALGASTPTLAEMTKAALERLAPSPSGFLLQIEGGRVDHAAHANDAAGAMWDQIAFDDAIGEVLRFVGGHPGTLVVITTDHGNSNPGLIGMGGSYRDSTKCFERLAQATGSVLHMYHVMSEQGGRDRILPADDVIDIVRAHTQITLERDEAEAVASTLAGKRTDDLHHQHRSFVGAMGQSLGNHTGIGWTGTSHTSDLAPTLAVGPGSGRFGTIMHHTEVFGVLTALWGIEHINPSMTMEQAKQHTHAIPVVNELHWA